MEYILAFLTLYAIVIFVISAIRIVIIAIRYIKWRKVSVPAIGIVGEINDVTCEYNRNGDVCSYSFNYALKIISQGQEYDDIYSEECKPGKTPSTCPGDTLNLLWSIRDHKYLHIAKTGKEIWQVVKRESAYILHFTFLIFGNLRYFRENHRSRR